MTSHEIARQQPGELSPAEQLIERIESERFQRTLDAALPGNVSPKRFTGIAISALLNNPDLVNAEPNSVIRALLKGAETGLLPDGFEAAIIIFNTKVKDPDGRERWEKRAQFLPMIGGYRKVAAEYGWTIQTRVVHANDEYDYDPVAEKITHRPARLGTDKGELIGAYGRATHRDGRVMVEQMDRAEVEKARAVSRASSKGPWVDWEERMYEKTVGRRLFKKLPLGEREIVARILAADLTPEQSTDALYGSDRQALPDVHSADDAPELLPAASEAGPTDLLPHEEPAGPATPEDGGEASGFQPPELATDAQKTKLDVLYGQLTRDDENLKRDFCTAAGGREGERWPEVRERLTKRFASVFIDHLEKSARPRDAA
jgi:recombination protein RecT